MQKFVASPEPIQISTTGQDNFDTSNVASPEHKLQADTDKPMELELWDKNIETYKAAIKAYHEGKTRRIPTEIPNKESIIEMICMIHMFPLGFDPKEMRKLAKKIKAPIRDFGKTWHHILVANLYKGIKYVIIENSKKTFVCAVDVEAIVDKFQLTRQHLDLYAYRFDIH